MGDFMFRGTKAIRYAGVLALAGTLLFAFQNCVFTSADMQSYSSGNKSKSARIAGGNGDSYEGKLEVSAPENQAPGVPVEVSVKGGAPPYTLSSSAETGEFIFVNTNQYLFQLGSEETARSVVVQARDSMGNVAETRITILGINKWHFDDPDDVDYLMDGSVAFLENDGNTLVILSSEGRLTHRAELGAGYSSLHQLGPDQILLSRGVDFSVFNTKTEYLEEVASASSECGEVARVFAADSLAFYSCKTDQRVFLTDLDSGESEILTVSGFGLKNWADLIGVFPVGDAELQLVFSDGSFLRTQMNGAVLKSWKLNTPDSEIKNLNYTDSGVLANGDLVLLSEFKRHIHIIDPLGERVKRLGARGSEDGAFDKVNALSVLNGEKIVVTDPVNDRISIFDRSGGFSHAFGANSSRTGAFNEPVDVKYAENGDLYVLGKVNKRIQVFASNGSFKFSLNSKTDNLGTGQWWSPYHFQLTPSGRIVLADKSRFRAHSFSVKSEAATLTVGGDEGSDNGEFRQPQGAVQLSDGRMIVADTNNDRLQEFSAAGGWLKTLSESNGKEIKRPYDVELHPITGHIYLLVEGRTNIKVFDQNLNYLKSIKGSGEAAFHRPANMSFDSQGNIYLADEERHRVVKMSENGVFLREFRAPDAMKLPLNRPKSMAVSPDGSKLAIADTKNDRILILPIND